MPIIHNLFIILCLHTITAQLTINLIVFFSLFIVTATFILELESEPLTDVEEVSLNVSLNTSGATLALISLMASLTVICGQQGSNVNEKLALKLTPLPLLDFFVY